MNLPRLIIFEGADAAGKSTVCDEYLKALAPQGIAAKLLAFPGNCPGTIGHLVYQLHHDPHSMGVERLTAASLQALHIAAHLDAIESVIVPTLEAGETVVLDRYWWSTWVYGLVGGASPRVPQSLIDTERLAWGRWLPSIVFYVTRSFPLRNEPIETWESLRSEYDALATREKENYPVYILSNDGDLAGTVKHALTRSFGDKEVRLK